jgi:hypothetical protein
MNDGRIFVATFENVTIGTAVQSIMEVQVPDNTIIEILRAWLSPAIGTPLDEVIAISLYGNNDAATGGAALTEQPMTPAAAIDPSNCTALGEPTIGASPLVLYSDAYHLQNGWLYAPVPEEMENFFGGNLDPGDNVGLELAIASTATPAVSGGIRWKEISVA